MLQSTDPPGDGRFVRFSRSSRPQTGRRQPLSQTPPQLPFTEPRAERVVFTVRRRVAHK
jgi:hypothetical protein